MPGAFNSPGLIPLSAPTVGQLPPPGIAQQLGQAAGQYPDMLQQAAKDKLAMDSQKLNLKKQQAEMDDTESKNAMGKLGFFYRLMMGDQSGLKSKDPQMIAAVSNAGKTAGVGPLTITDPTTGAQVVDVAGLKHLVDSKLLSQLDDTTQTQIGGALPEQRPGMLEMHGVDPSTVSKETLNQPPVLQPKDRQAVRTDVMKLFKDYTTGNSTIGALTTQLNSMLPEMQAAGMSIEDVKSYLTGDDYQQAIGPAVQAKINNMDALGISKEAQAAYIKQKTIDEPKDLASKIETRAGRLVIQQKQLAINRGALDIKAAAQRDQAAKTKGYLDQVKSNIQNAKSKTGIDALGVSVKIASKNLDILKSKRSDLGKEANSYILNRQQVPDDIMQQMQDIDGQISDGQATLSTAYGVGDQMTNGAFSRMTGKPAVLGGRNDGTNYGPVVAHDKQGKPVYNNGGKFVYADGTEYKP